MGNDRIIAAWNKMNPDNSTKEKILQEIQDTVKAEKSHNFSKKFHRFGIGLAAAIVLFAGSFGTAYAASPTFREYIHSLLFPLYASDDIVSIENGHMTGSFDNIDVLLSFLDKYDKMEFGNTITAKKESGYRYSLFIQGDDQLIAFVDSNVDDYCIAVYMEQITYENTTGIWQVTGYQILEKSTAENMKNQMEPYSDTPTREIISSPPEDTSIKAMEDSIIIYNVNEKENVVSLSTEDCQTVSNILSMCDKYSDIQGDLFQYVIKINDTSYMFDSNGNGMINSTGERWGITLSENDLVALKSLFRQYDVSLDSTPINQIDNSSADESSPESDNHSVVTDLPLNDDSVTIGDVSLSLSESRQDLLAKLEAAGIDYSEVPPAPSKETSYDLYYNAAGCLQIYFLDDTCVRIRLIDLDSASDWNTQTARGLHPGNTYSQMIDLYGEDYETHAYSYKGIYTIYRYSIGDYICEFGIEGENGNSIYNIDIYLPCQLPIYEYGEEIQISKVPLVS